MSRSSWTWHNLWNLLTINFNYTYFRNFDQSFISKCISLPDWKNEKWLLKIVFVKVPRPWHDLIIIPPCRTAPPPVPPPFNKMSLVCPEKLLEKGLPPYFMVGHYALTSLENRLGSYASQYLHRSAD